MRPLKLTMTGFGPYKNTNTIDMESLGRGGLYLITGVTGAGKTFIFDAITYALYGDMSGSGRESRSVRSQYSPDGEKTEVELEFEYFGHKYKVTRNPEYFRAKNRGEGFTKQTAGATLIKPDGSVVDGSAKVNEEIKNILGIDRGQFCSIAMIAQGEFRKALNASTDERQKLFRKLFNTQPYSRLSEELKELSKKNQEEYNDGLHSMRLALSSVSYSFDESLSASINDLKERSNSDSVTSAEICEMLGSLAEAGKTKAAEIAEKLASVEAKLTDLNNKIALAKDHRKNINSLESAKESIPLLEAAIENAQRALAEANEKKSEIEKLESEASLIEASMDSYDLLDSISAELKSINKELETKTGVLSDAGKAKELLKTKLEDSETQLKELKSSGEDLIRISNDIEKSVNRVSALDALKKDIEAVSKLQEKLEKQREELKPVIANAEALEGEYSRMLSAYMREQAGILAETLEDGSPCPVCGSVHHPQPAEKSQDAPSKDELEAKQNEAKRVREKASAMTGEVQQTSGNLDSLTGTARASAMNVTGSDDLMAAGEAANNEISSLKEALIRMREEENDYREKAKKAEELNAAVPEIRKSLEEISAKEQAIGNEINGLNSSEAAAEARFEQVKKDLAYGSKDEAGKAAEAKSAEAKRLRNNIETASKKLNEADASKKANDARISELARVVAGYEPVDETQAIEDAAAAEAEKRSLTDDSILVAAEQQSAKGALEAVRKGAEDLDRIRRKHEIIDSLNRTANGGLAGKERITLEAYVQAFYFERIIRRANIRLRMMSDGQYEFVRAGGSGDKRHLSGLDLSVVDHYSGTERPVSTLSGGESFMASLSLALGLSDEVQASAGGIRLDTMFVDEGFGSLDSETLEKAIRTLTELSDEDKLVGIISHVDALKSRIENQIVVTKDRDAGSRATLVKAL